MTWLKNIAGVFFAFAAALSFLAAVIYSYAILVFGETAYMAQLAFAAILWVTATGCVLGAFKFRFRSGPNGRQLKARAEFVNPPSS